MRGRLTLGLAVLRTVGLGALLMLLVNPTRSRTEATGSPPLVLLDASLSMIGTNGLWPAALDSARRLAAGGTIWRFGDDVTTSDTGPPTAGVSRLAPALAAAAARGDPIVVVTDGAIGDVVELPLDLRRRPRVLVLSRAPFFDAFVAAVDGPKRASATDTIRLRVAYGTAGVRGGPRRATLIVSNDGRRLAARDVALPDSGMLTSELTFPAARLPAGWSALEVRIDGVRDAEPRDDARRLALEVSPQPAAVVLASPPDWESRFFAQALAQVARVPVRVLVETEPGRWRDGSTLLPVGDAEVARATSGARLVALIGGSRRLAPHRRPGGLIVWPLEGERAGDWYVDPPAPSPIAGALAGIAWESLPPATALAIMATDSSHAVLLTARLGRRGPSRPLVTLRDSAGARTILVTGAGLWRWAFRGGAPAEAYRALVAAVTDWLLGARAPGVGRVEPVATEATNGTPLVWRWMERGEPRPLPILLESARGTRRDTLHFDAVGRAELLLPPGAYRWRLPNGAERGLVLVEEYSDEWRPTAPTLVDQSGEPGGSRHDVGARDHWWLYVLAIAAFAGEWAWRRRQGLP